MLYVAQLPVETVHVDLDFPELFGDMSMSLLWMQSIVDGSSSPGAGTAEAADEEDERREALLTLRSK